MRKDIEARMRELEYFRRLQLVPGAWTVLRLDGRGFTRFTAARFDKPFDVRLRDLMTAAARSVMEDFQGLYAVTHSDEISIVFPPKWEMFDRRLEKLVSISAGLASAAFTQACGETAHFDSRAWLDVSEQNVVEYFRWRQEEAARCALHGWCYWTLRGRTAWRAKRRCRRCGARARLFRTSCCSSMGSTSTICLPGSGAGSACTGKAIKKLVSIRCEGSQLQQSDGASESTRCCRRLKPMRNSCAS
jgi:tRNA(His) 5'-end guanylyltransferase